MKMPKQIYLVFLIPSMFVFQNCTFKSYITRVSVKPYFLGKEIIHPKYQQQGVFVYEYEGLKLTEYKSGLKEFTEYHLGKIIDNYFIENGDTINRLRYGLKEGLWHEYVPCVKQMKVGFFIHNELKYSYIEYLGKPIAINLYDDTLRLQANNKICFGTKDSSFNYLYNKKDFKFNIRYIQMTKKKQFSLISYVPGDSTDYLIELEFYKRNKISSKRITSNNNSKNIIYDKKGNIIYQSSDGEMNLDMSDPRVKRFLRNDDRISKVKFPYTEWSCDFTPRFRITGSWK